MEVVQRRDEESARAGREVAKPLAELRIEARDDEVRKGAGRVELAGVARALEVFENALVDVAEGVPVFGVGEVYLVDDVHDLAEKDAVLLVLVEVGKHLADDCLAHGRLRRDDNSLERGEKLVDEREELFASEGGADILAAQVLHVSPIAPTVLFGDDGDELALGLVSLVLPFRLLGVIDLEEEKPHHLLDALGVAADACVAAHDVLKTLDEVLRCHCCYATFL